MSDLSRRIPIRLAGSERFRFEGRDLDFDATDFWSWSASDLLSNATRGVLAEYIVARALNVPASGVRDEWAAYDLQLADGIKIEVKSAAYLQGWYQKTPSQIIFRVGKARAWDAETNLQSAEAMRSADVYVFALLAHRDKATVDPLDLDQWSFFVVATPVLDARTRSQHSITLSSLVALECGPITYAELARAVVDARTGVVPEYVTDPPATAAEDTA